MTTMDTIEATGIRPSKMREPVPALSTVAVLGLPFQMPERYQALALEGAAAVLAGAPVPPTPATDGVPVAEEVARQQAMIRRDCLMKLLPPMREDCKAGLTVLDDDQFPNEIQAWLNDPHSRTLILAGGTGNGKTQAAYATAAQAARFGAMMWDSETRQELRRPLIVRGWSVNNYLRALLPDGSPDPVWKIRHSAVWAELLILDDLGAELDATAREWMRKEIADLLDDRLERNLRTIFTTNLASDVVEDRLGDRLWSRIQQHSTCLEFTGPDRRAIKKLSWGGRR